MTEKEMQKKIKEYFEKFFIIEEEVYDVTHQFRIDLIMVHKSDIEKKYPFGIEIKVNEKKKGKDLANWLKQASNYSTLNFKEYGKCIILVAPPIQLNYLREGFDVNNHEGGKLINSTRIPAESFEKASFNAHNNVSTFLGAFGVGEIISKKINNQKFYSFILSGSILYDMYDNELRINNIQKVWK